MALNQSINAIRTASVPLRKKLQIDISPSSGSFWRAQVKCGKKYETLKPTEVFRRALLHEPCESVANSLSHSPQLVVLFTWIGAKEKTAHKFVDAWNNRGFNVLHVTSTVMDLVRPKTGTEVTAMKVAEFLTKYDQYNVIIHGLSVGGYLGQRVLMRLHEENVKPKLTHQIYDSFTQVAGFESGVENAVDPKFRSLVRAGVKLYTKVADLSCLDETREYIMTVPTPSPTFFMHSLADRVAQYSDVEVTLPSMARENPVSTFILPKSDKIPHVALFRHMGEQPYMSLVTRFLRRHSFTPLRAGVLLEEDPNSPIALTNESLIKKVRPLE